MSLLSFDMYHSAHGGFLVQETKYDVLRRKDLRWGQGIRIAFLIFGPAPPLPYMSL